MSALSFCLFCIRIATHSLARMDMLANYASDSESDSEHTTPPTVPKQQTPIRQNESRTQGSAPLGGVPEPSAPGARSSSDVLVTQTSTDPADSDDEDVVMEDNSEDEHFVSTSLKFLQDFAASVDQEAALDSETKASTPMDEAIAETKPTFLSEAEPAALSAVSEEATVETVKDDDPPPTPTTMTLEQQQLFDSFMARINALPLTLKDQSRPPPSSNPGALPELDLQWQQEASVQSIYSRIHQLSLLSSPLIQSQSKELEKALIKFAIRILDWEKNGLKASYFLGEERSKALDRRKQLGSQGIDRDSSMDGDMDNDEMDRQDTNNNDSKGTEELAPYSGVVGNMLETMMKVEKEAAPEGWKLIWDPQENAYEFFHLRTGTQSILYPSTQLLHQLDPPFSKSKSPSYPSPIDVQ